MTAMYRIGPSDSFTSGDLAADAATLDRQIKLLDDQNMDKVGQQFFDGWIRFPPEWRRFYADVFLDSIIGAGWNNANRDQLIQFETRFETWVSQWENETGLKFPGGTIAPSTGTKATLGNHVADQFIAFEAVLSSYKWWFVGAGIVVGAVLFREPLAALASKAVGSVK